MMWIFVCDRRRVRLNRLYCIPYGTVFNLLRRLLWVHRHTEGDHRINFEHNLVVLIAFATTARFRDNGITVVIDLLIRRLTNDKTAFVWWFYQRFANAWL